MYACFNKFLCVQVILVGHSAGGLSVTAATHKFARKISLAVYIGATMLKNGMKTEQDFKDVSLINFNPSIF